MTVGVVVPAYRPDVDTLVAAVDSLAAAIDPAAIRIELDAAGPDTVDAVRRRVPEASVHAVATRRGKGAAITAGFEALETDVFAFADADGATAPASVAAVVDAVEGGADLAVGSRRHPDAEVTAHQSMVRTRLGDCFAWLARRLLSVPLYDYQCGAKAIGRTAWRDVREYLCEPGFGWDVELVAVAGARGHRIEEVPVAWADGERSTVSPVGTPVELVGALVRAWHRANRLRGRTLHAAVANRRRGPVPLIDHEND